MSTYKLYYFNGTGLGESIRFMLSYGGAQFEDIRYSFDDWKKHKNEMPMGQMPVLEIDGKKYNQSSSICRYLAKKFNLYGNNDLEALEIDAAVDNIDDMRAPLALVHGEKDPTFKAALKERALHNYKKFMAKFEEQVKRNGGFFVGGKMTWADVYFASLICHLLTYFLGHDVNKDYPALKKLEQTVLSNPGIKAYVLKRLKAVL